MTITTLAGGTPQLPTSSPYDTTSGKGTPSTDLVGSSVPKPVRGTLQGKLTANGNLTLTLKGKPVSKLQSGRYSFAIADQDRKGGAPGPGSVEARLAQRADRDDRAAGRTSPGSGRSLLHDHPLAQGATSETLPIGRDGLRPGDVDAARSYNRGVQRGSLS
jgi:hypothetical protein